MPVREIDRSQTHTHKHAYIKTSTTWRRVAKLVRTDHSAAAFTRDHASPTCVCVCVRERERDTHTHLQTETETHKHKKDTIELHDTEYKDRAEAKDIATRVYRRLYLSSLVFITEPLPSSYLCHAS